MRVYDDDFRTGVPNIKGIKLTPTSEGIKDEC